jgi:hypothetical protein
MPSKKIFIQSEYSAQRLSAPPNPAIGWALNALETIGHRPPFSRAADVGCGKLRHLNILAPLCKRLILVDTNAQISMVHSDHGQAYTIPEFARKRSTNERKISVLLADSFAQETLALEIIFCIAVLDVVPRQVRQNIIAASSSNLRKGGHFVVIAPRNDQSITSRFTDTNKYLDGHLFVRQGITTFFCNFKSYESIINDCKRAKFSLAADVSKHRQVCLLFSKT